MDTNKILSANILDLIFDNRNKEYGAYELRNTYQRRMAKALGITASILLLLIASLLLLKSSEVSEPVFIFDGHTIVDIKPPEIKPEIPKPEKKLPPPQVKTVMLTPPVIVDKLILDQPLPEIKDVEKAKIGTANIEGIDNSDTVQLNNAGNGKGVTDVPKTVEPNEPFRKVEVDARFSGNWENFLRRNLNANVPADNGAPAGNHTIIIQFVVDIDGSVSDIKQITNLGYGMEQEAIRVLKKATKWEPAIQNGHPVKAFRRQPITFQVLGE
jgi:protein TonB